MILMLSNMTRHFTQSGWVHSCVIIFSNISDFPFLFLFSIYEVLNNFARNEFEKKTVSRVLSQLTVVCRITQQFLQPELPEPDQLCTACRSFSG